MVLIDVHCLSIARFLTGHASHVVQIAGNVEAPESGDPSAALVYSASTSDELAFRDHLIHMAERSRGLHITTDP